MMKGKIIKIPITLTFKKSSSKHKSLLEIFIKQLKLQWLLINFTLGLKYLIKNNLGSAITVFCLSDPILTLLLMISLTLPTKRSLVSLMWEKMWKIVKIFKKTSSVQRSSVKKQKIILLFLKQIRQLPQRVQSSFFFISSTLTMKLANIFLKREIKFTYKKVYTIFNKVNTRFYKAQVFSSG